jgi:hypothetical protein
MCSAALCLPTMPCPAPLPPFPPNPFPSSTPTLPPPRRCRTMGLIANYPWVVSTQLGTNTYFVNNVLQPFTPCGAYSTLTGDDTAW